MEVERERERERKPRWPQLTVIWCVFVVSDSIQGYMKCFKSSKVLEAFLFGSISKWDILDGAMFILGLVGWDVVHWTVMVVVLFQVVLVGMMQKSDRRRMDFWLTANVCVCSQHIGLQRWTLWENMSNIHELFLHVACIISSKHEPSWNIFWWFVAIPSSPSTARHSWLSLLTLPISHWHWHLSHIYSKIVSAAN